MKYDTLPVVPLTIEILRLKGKFIGQSIDGV